MHFIKLKELDLSNNKIGDSAELLKLRGLTSLHKLYFDNNPFLHEPIDE
jgi:Leucine-rich repeat (LRR) protein